jgi:beta-galactosidase
MKRRSLLSAGAIALGGSKLLLARSQRDARKPLPAAARYTLSLNRNWLYGGRAVAVHTAEAVDDSKFERVTLPHANVRLPWHGFDDKAFQFSSIYRRHLRLPGELKGRRIFVDFGGVMTAATVFLNGHKLGSHLGGYTPFSFELTKHLNWDADNVLAVEVDSTERPDIPPFGNVVDYLTFGGIYREVSLRAVPDTFIEDIFARPADVLTKDRKLRVRCFFGSPATSNARTYALEVLLLDGGKTVATARREVIPTQDSSPVLELTGLESVELWNIHHPKLYEVLVRLRDGDRLLDEYTTRTGFREAIFTPEGFRLNGKTLKLRGLDRHQTYPYVGGAMPARVQRRDAQILKQELKCNVVRTSHYPQSPHFLDTCDELGLLVFEEIPGWQHIGDKSWQDLAVQNVGDIIRRDWNHPAIILWDVRINESKDNHELYTRTNALAHQLDDSRQTGGVRNFMSFELIEDVFTSNDFGFPLKAPNHPHYLNTEFAGHMFSTKSWDTVEHVTEHVIRHARVHNQIASDVQYAGGLGWCAFDCNTHGNFGSGDRICYHGVSDIFRIPKPAAQFYRSHSATRKKRLCWSLVFTGRKATNPRPGVSAARSSPPIAIT